MLRSASTGPRSRAAAVAVAAALLVSAGAGSAAAAEGPPSEVAGATGATALTVTVNLPGGKATRLLLTLDPVTGEASRVGPTTAALARSELLRGSLGAQTMGTGASEAKLPAPLTVTSDPAARFNAGLAGSPLADLLTVRFAPSTAAVTPSPSSTSQASIAELGVGLPSAVADGLAPLLGPLTGGLDALLSALATQTGQPVAQLCAGVTEAVTELSAATAQLEPVLAALPVKVPAAQLLDEAALGALCSLPAVLDRLRAALRAALATLAGPAGVLGTGAITSSQTITTTDRSVKAEAAASVTALRVLGQQALVGAEALRTRSSATAAGTPGSAQAEVESTVAGLRAGTVDPFAQVRVTIDGIVDSYAGAGQLPPALGTLFRDLIGTLGAALGPLGVTLLDGNTTPESSRLSGCPTGLDGRQTGTFEAADGKCAAAATRGVGVSVSLPAQLATALQIGGPLVELKLVPTAAAVRVQPTAVLAAGSTARIAPKQLPRTGTDGSLAGGLALALLLGAALLRRRSGRPAA